jgi:hypothetical protein
VTENRNLAARAGRWSAQHRKIAIWGWLGCVLVVFMIGSAAKTVTQENSQSGVGEWLPHLGPGDGRGLPPDTSRPQPEAHPV